MAQISERLNDEGDLFICRGKRRPVKRWAIRDALRLKGERPTATARVRNTRTNEIVWPDARFR
jgi:hypothetical protein